MNPAVQVTRRNCLCLSRSRCKDLSRLQSPSMTHERSRPCATSFSILLKSETSLSVTSSKTTFKHTRLAFPAGRACACFWSFFSASRVSESFRVFLASGLPGSAFCRVRASSHAHHRFPTLQLCFQHWWRMTGSNRRPPACKAGALPAELIPRSETLVGLVGIEPTTPALSRRCSNRLSYRPFVCFAFPERPIGCGCSVCFATFASLERR